MDSFKRGKSNKLGIGTTVQVSQRLVDWYATHLVWSNGTPMDGSDPAYDEGDKEILEKDLKDVYFWAHCKLAGELPQGETVRYGMPEDSERTGKMTKRKVVFVELKISTSLGTFTYGAFMSEKDLTKCQ